MLHVDGIPRPQPRPRFVRGRVISCVDANAKRWISAVEAKARELRHQDAPLKGGLFVGLDFTFPAGKGRQEGEPHTSRPDADNLAKLVLDALMRAGLIGDDAVVSCLMIRKSYGAKPGVLIYLNQDRRAPAIQAPHWID
jgi:Holliday junction resolvase RusA-like endonuclease